MISNTDRLISIWYQSTTHTITDIINVLFSILQIIDSSSIEFSSFSNNFFFEQKKRSENFSAKKNYQSNIHNL